MLLPNQEHPPRSDHESSGYESKASYLISTSNHNSVGFTFTGRPLLLISFLHQTTTVEPLHLAPVVLLLISFLHQTTTASRSRATVRNCFLSHFYIKPQPFPWRVGRKPNCFLSHFYIKPQLSAAARSYSTDCFLSHFYIKPQHTRRGHRHRTIASYLISTSNHNYIVG